MGPSAPKLTPMKRIKNKLMELAATFLNKNGYNVSGPELRPLDRFYVEHESVEIRRLQSRVIISDRQLSQLRHLDPEENAKRIRHEVVGGMMDKLRPVIEANLRLQKRDGWEHESYFHDTEYIGEVFIGISKPR